MAAITDCSGQLLTDYRIFRLELVVASFVVLLGVLLLVNVYKVLSYALDVVSSAYLLWATFTRKFYLHSTSVGQWANNVCSAIMGDKELIYKYLAVSVVSWVASSYLEYNSVLRYKKLYYTRLWRCLRQDVWSRLSRRRWLVLTLALICTINSLALTLVVWGTVRHSFENVSKDRFITTVNTIAAMMRLLRQFVESLAFIAGIVTRDFRWRNSKEEKLMGRIAFSSFMLLIHTSVLTYTFCNLQVWSANQLILFSSLLVDVTFRFILCVWAALNSCCYARAKKYIKNLAFQHIVRGLINFSSTTIHSLYRSTVSTANVACSLVRGFLHFCAVAVRTFLMFAVGTIRLAYFCVGVVLTVFVEAWRDYVLHWHIDVDFDDPAIELFEPVQIQLVYQETRGHSDNTPREVVFPSYSVCNRDSHDPHHTQCNVLADAIRKSQYGTQDRHSSLVVLPFPPSTMDTSSYTVAPTVHEPSSQQEESESTRHSCLCTFECSPQLQSVPPYSSHTSPPQPLPVRQRDALIAPALPSTKLGPRSELVAR